MNKRKTPAPAHGGRQHGVERPAPAPRDPIVGGLAVAGLAIALYLTITKLAGSTAAFCESGSGCDVLQASRWSTFLGVPTAAWGALLYAGLAALALTGLPPARWIWAFVLACAAVGFSAYLTYVAAFVVRALCPWCLAVALIGVASLVALIVRRPVGGGRTMRPARLATVGAVTALVTIVVAAGVFVKDPMTGDGGLASDLAKHLEATNQIMYGAFW